MNKEVSSYQEILRKGNGISNTPLKVLPDTVDLFWEKTNMVFKVKIKYNNILSGITEWNLKKKHLKKYFDTR